MFPKKVEQIVEAEGDNARQATNNRRARGAAAIRERLGWEPTSEDDADRNLETNLDHLLSTRP